MGTSETFRTVSVGEFSEVWLLKRVRILRGLGLLPGLSLSVLGRVYLIPKPVDSCMRGPFLLVGYHS
jgi:hypothetical protein